MTDYYFKNLNKLTGIFLLPLFTTLVFIPTFRNRRAAVINYSLLFVLLLACNKTDTGSSVVSFNIEDAILNYEHVMLSEIAEEITYIPLETIEESIIADIREVVITSEYILIRDDFGKLLLFNRKGEFLRKIGQKGRGPNEYSTANKIRISNANELYVLDLNNLKILKFDLHTGKCIGNSKVNFIPSDFEFFNDTTLAFYCSAASFHFSQKNHHFYFMDARHLNITDSLFKGNGDHIKDLYKIDYGFINLYKRQNKLFCWDSNLDTTFYLNENKELIKSHVFEFNKFKMPPFYRYNSDFLKTKDNYFFLDDQLETDKYFFLEGIYKNSYGKYILVKKSERTARDIVFNYDIQDRGFTNDIDGGIPFWPVGYAGPNELYDYKSPVLLKKMMQNDYFKQIPVANKIQHKQLKELLDSCSITDNPIIYIAKLRK